MKDMQQKRDEDALFIHDLSMSADELDACCGRNMKALNDTMAAWVNDEIRRETEPQLVLQAILEFFMLSSASLIAHWLPEDDYDKVDAISNALAQTMAIEVPQIFQRIVEANARGE